jgi:hypothetical protein
MQSASLYQLVEIIAVWLLVLGCAAYCALRLASNALTRRIRAAFLGLPLPATFKLKLATRRKKPAGCSADCSGCASAASRR